MLRFFQQIQRSHASQKLFKQTVALVQAGKKEEALSICEKLVEEYPQDVQFRHRLAKLQLDLGKEINLPNIQPTNTLRH